MYHVSKRKLGIGSSLTLGMYGERISTPDFIANNYKNYIKEKIFEEVRKTDFPHWPSRLDCIFLLPSFSVAQMYNAYLKKYDSYIYEVTLEEENPFIAEMDLLDCDGREYEVIQDFAKKYWSQTLHQDSCSLEVLAKGRVVVKELLQEPSRI